MMDAVKFLEEKERMCRFFTKNNCVGCPFHEAIQGVTTSCCAMKEHLWLNEDYVSSVLNWSNLHPVLEIGDEVYSTVDRPPYGMVISPDYDGYTLVLWESGLVGALSPQWLTKTGTHYPMEEFMEEMKRDRSCKEA